MQCMICGSPTYYEVCNTCVNKVDKETKIEKIIAHIQSSIHELDKELYEYYIRDDFDHIKNAREKIRELNKYLSSLLEK